MALLRLFDPTTQFQTKSGALNVAGKLRVYVESTDDLANIYGDDFSLLSQPLILDSNGRARGLFVDSGRSYRLEVYDRNDSLLFTIRRLEPNESGTIISQTVFIKGTPGEIDVEDSVTEKNRTYTVSLSSNVTGKIAENQEAILKESEARKDADDDKVDKVYTATENHIAVFDNAGNIKDSGKTYADMQDEFKRKQTAKSSPTAAGNALSFIDTVSQDAEGVITATKKSVTVDSTYSSSGTNPVNGKAIKAAIDGLDVSSVGGDGKYISTISETDGKISATATSLATAPVSGSDVAITAGGVYTALAAKQDAIPDAGSAANPVHFKDGKAVAGDSINNCKLTLKVGDATVGDGFTANAGADFEYRVTGNQIASALNAGRGIDISGNTVSTNLPLSNDNGATVKKGIWYIFAMANVTGGAWERCWDFLIASNHNSSAQMRLFISPRITASGSIESDTIVQVEGHVTPAQLAKYKIATVNDSSGKLYCCLCVKHSNSNENRTVQWNLRNARGISWWAESAPLSNYTVVSERLLSESMPSNRLVCYKPTNKAAVGNATQPVYVDEYGMIKACSSMPKFVIGTPAGAANTIYFT